MNSREIAHLRLINQHLGRIVTPAAPAIPATGSVSPVNPAGLVRRMACIQAQDYSMAKWALGCRLPGTTDAGIEKDFNEGRILRTHVLRPTWHFVCPEDVRWMLRLSAPKVRALARPYHRQLGIDGAVLKKSKTLLTKSLVRHGRLTRPQLMEIFRQARIDTTDARMGHLLMDAELDGLIISAGRIGKQFAYGLLDLHAPVSGSGSADISNEEAIAELAGRYFPTRGPATVYDFAWWAGLTLTEARQGLDAVRSQLSSDNEYWFAPAAAVSSSLATAPAKPSMIYLLPAFDEYTVAYSNRDDVLDPAHAALCFHGLKPIVVHNTRITGMWQRTIKKGKAVVEVMPFKGAKPVPAKMLGAAIKKYEKFMASPA